MYKSTALIFGLLLAVSRPMVPPACAAPFPAVLVPEDLGGTSGFIVHGKDYEQFGKQVAGIGDVNADGWDDIISGDDGLLYSPGCYCESTLGMAYVIFGGPGVAGDGVWSVSDLDGTNGFGIPALQMGDYTGYVSAAGDFNNDGVADFLVGAPASTLGGWSSGGACFVIYGRPDIGSAGSFELAALDGQNGFAIYGSLYNHGIGGRMAAIGDFNADGADDIALGSTWVSPSGRQHAGQCYVLFGGRDLGASGVFRMSERTPQNSITINGIAAGDSVGIAVAGAGDVNGDGHPDIIIGSAHDEPPGEAYVVFGGRDVTSNGVFELSSLDGENGFIVRCVGGLYAGGTQVAGPGDMNGDGYDDVAVVDTRGAPSSWWVDVVFGGANVAPTGVLESASLDGTNGFKIDSGEESSAVGVPSSVGDLDHDGIADIAVDGAYTYVVFGDPRVGGDTGRVNVHLLSGADGFRFNPPVEALYADGAGDVNGDGIDDLMISAVYEQHSFLQGADRGQVFVIFGRRQSGDADGDGDLDLADFMYWTLCMLGPGGGPYVPGCEVFDFDLDGHVDLGDFAGLQDVFGE